MGQTFFVAGNGRAATMSTREALIMLLLLAIATSGAAWFLATHERYEADIWVGYRGEARRNPWLGAQRFLERYDISTTEVRALPELRNLTPEATLVIPKSHHLITASLRDHLVGWVEQGGLLIVEAEYAGVDDTLTGAFGVRRLETQYDEFDEEPDEEADAPGYETISLPGASAAATVDFQTYTTLDGDDAWFRADGKYGTYLLVVRRGDGTAIIVNDLDFLRNNVIGSHDHARFLLHLLGLREYIATTGISASASGAGPVMFFNRPGKLSLFDWLKKNAWATMAGAAVALLCWLWRVVPRFGPVAPDPERARRRLLDHLRASGRFLWANGHAMRLLEASREACLRRIGRAFPHFLSANVETRTAQLVDTLGITEEQAQRILKPQENAKMLQFLQTIRLYQSVLSRLAASHPTSTKD
jgi:hypothetical protein